MHLELARRVSCSVVAAEADKRKSAHQPVERETHCWQPRDHVVQPTLLTKLGESAPVLLVVLPFVLATRVLAGVASILVLCPAKPSPLALVWLVVCQCRAGSSDLRAHIVIVGRSGWACVRAGARACTGARSAAGDGAGGEFGLCALQEGCNVDAALRAGAMRTDDDAIRLEADVAETRHALGALSRVAATRHHDRSEAARANLVMNGFRRWRRRCAGWSAGRATCTAVTAIDATDTAAAVGWRRSCSRGL
mmetsp:Transcript_22792/g.75043  ORF Transcript_22792/g.75043 Transcript_22792/m.75043 type:complete len:251 (-) Transcript_22792:7-759(-)